MFVPSHKFKRIEDQGHFPSDSILPRFCAVCSNHLFTPQNPFVIVILLRGDSRHPKVTPRPLKSKSQPFLLAKQVAQKTGQNRFFQNPVFENRFSPPPMAGHPIQESCKVVFPSLAHPSRPPRSDKSLEQNNQWEKDWCHHVLACDWLADFLLYTFRLPMC